MRLTEKINEHIKDEIRLGTKRNRLLSNLKTISLNFIFLIFLFMVFNKDIQTYQMVLGIILSIFALYNFYIYNEASKLNQIEILLDSPLDNFGNKILFKELEKALNNINNFDLEQRSKLSNNIYSAINDGINATEDGSDEVLKENRFKSEVN